jgi:response regulator of citrate/malate metabolism
MTRNRIIIADNSEMQGHLTEAWLLKELPSHYFYNQISNGQELERILRDSNSDIALAIIDNDIPPGPTGSELITKYSKKVEFPLILHYSAKKGQEWVGEKALRDGASAILLKPQYKDVAVKAKELLGVNS